MSDAAPPAASSAAPNGSGRHEPVGATGAGGTTTIHLDAWPLPALLVDPSADAVVAQNAAAEAWLGPRRARATEIVEPADRAAFSAALSSMASPAVPARVRVLALGGAVAADARVSRLSPPSLALVVLVAAASGAPGADAESAVAAAEARWRGRAQELEAVREDEKRRVARELHDRLGADLSLLRIDLARLVPKLSWARAEVRETIERLRDHAGELLETVRRISRELRPRVLDHVAEVGLASVLEHVTSEVHRRAGFVVHLDARLSERDDAAIDPARAEAAYHVVREALNNVVRHSGATRAVVAARIERASAPEAAAPGTLLVEVLDDGRGATPGAPGETAAGPEGIGWWSLSERVRAFGGDVSVRAEPGVGTTVSARIPLAKETPP